MTDFSRENVISSKGGKATSRKNEGQNRSISGISDTELLNMLKEYGRQALSWRQLFGGLLPEFHRRGLWKNIGYQGIHHFAAVTAGFSRDLVNRIISVDRKLEKFPLLRNAFEEGKVGWSKFEVIAPLVTKESEVEWLYRVSSMPLKALRLLVFELKVSHSGADSLSSEGHATTGRTNNTLSGFDDLATKPNITVPETNNQFQERNIDSDSIEAPSSNASLSERTVNNLASKAQGKRSLTLEKDLIISLKNNLPLAERILVLCEDLSSRFNRRFKPVEALEYALNHMDHATDSIPRYKEIVRLDESKNARSLDTRWGTTLLSEEQLNSRELQKETIDMVAHRLKAKEKAKTYLATKLKERRPDRYIPAIIKEHVRLRDLGKCTFPGCHSKGRVLHHLFRYTLDPSHDPDGIISLCKKHDRLIHCGVIENELRPEHPLKISLSPKTDTTQTAKLRMIDRMVGHFHIRKSRELKRIPDTPNPSAPKDSLKNCGNSSYAVAGNLSFFHRKAEES